MEKIIKVELDRTQNSNATWILTTIKRLIIKPFKELGPPVFSFKRTQEAAQNNSQILEIFNRNLGAAIEYQKGSPLEYGSEFWDIAGIKNLFCHRKDKERIVDIIPKGLCYHLSPIDNTTRKSDP